MTMRLDEWCDTCKEYDQERHCCPRFNHVIRTMLDDVRKEAYKHGKSKGIKKGIAMSHKSGVWMYERGFAGFGKCSVCGSLWESSITQNCFCKYCPRCGAEMVDDVIKF